MNDTIHGHMVQDLLRHRFGSHDNLICKYSSKYPVQAEREFQRLTNAYIRILNELLKEYLPEIRDAARAERGAGAAHLYVWPAQQDRVYGKAHAEVEHP